MDVGGERKGLDVAILDAAGELLDTGRGLTPSAAAAVLAAHDVRLAGVDAPCAPAPDGERSRADERALARAGLCRIRWTPDRAALEANPAYYGWVLHGFAVYAALGEVGVAAVEVFPTAAWTAWHGSRGTRSRAAWSAEALAALGVRGAADATSQDARDAIAAAASALCADTPGASVAYGAIVVPVQGPPWSPHGHRG